MGTLQNERFLVYDKLNSDDNINYFAVDEGLKYWIEAHIWYCDSNFSLIQSQNNTRLFLSLSQNTYVSQDTRNWITSQI